jgi:hypothetical protein
MTKHIERLMYDKVAATAVEYALISRWPLGRYYGCSHPSCPKIMHKGA